jgi:hypothetical protein
MNLLRFFFADLRLFSSSLMRAPHVEHEVPPRKLPQERWAEIQRRGILSFVLWRGMFLMGLSSGIVCVLDLYFAGSGAQRDDWRFELFQFVVVVVVLGPFMALYDWRAMKRKLSDTQDPSR